MLGICYGVSLCLRDAILMVVISGIHLMRHVKTLVTRFSKAPSGSPSQVNGKANDIETVSPCEFPV